MSQELGFPEILSINKNFGDEREIWSNLRGVFGIIIVDSLGGEPQPQFLCCTG